MKHAFFVLTALLVGLASCSMPTANNSSSAESIATDRATKALPDLTIENIWVDNLFRGDAGNVDFSFKIANRGTASVRYSDLSYKAVMSKDTTLGNSDDVYFLWGVGTGSGSLAPGQKTATFKNHIPGSIFDKSRDWHLFLVVDPNNIVNESNEGNNVVNTAAPAPTPTPASTPVPHL